MEKFLEKFGEIKVLMTGFIGSLGGDLVRYITFDSLLISRLISRRTT
jgi:hypothetical protein